MNETPYLINANNFSLCRTRDRLNVTLPWLISRIFSNRFLKNRWRNLQANQSSSLVCIRFIVLHTPWFQRSVQSDTLKTIEFVTAVYFVGNDRTEISYIQTHAWLRNSVDGDALFAARSLFPDWKLITIIVATKELSWNTTVMVWYVNHTKILVADIYVDAFKTLKIKRWRWARNAGAKVFRWWQPFSGAETRRCVRPYSYQSRR